MAEIEHFIHPDKKFHPKFSTVENLVVNLYSSKNQLENLDPIEICLCDAVQQQVIANNVLAYYIGRTLLFMIKIGIDTSRVRFRQHLPKEKAHYACDCWDCEIHSYHGWVECVGIADRTCFDLAQHEQHSGQNMKFSEHLTTPIKTIVPNVVLNKSIIGKEFRSDAKDLLALLSNLSVEQALTLKKDLKHGVHCVELEGKNFTVTKEMVTSVDIEEKDVYVQEYYPHVVEPSFGIGRILYSLLSHTCMYREQDEQRIWFKFGIGIAPIKCLILPLSHKSEFQPVIQKIVEHLSMHTISYRVDDMNTSIGRRYARGDELGIPFAITVDFDTLNNKPETVTLRERNSTAQIRIEISDIGEILEDLMREKIDWVSLVKKYGMYEGQTSIS
ncbi:Glycine--tRNA ligase [Thelohanellus kitauei]|uniref:Glycine--tRNA ligase n=1 Tax=Thelohanellus kitauei TaxID=669202 RepID=A0A0C2IX61_THEKT|nr:Glycine--tRNA ligase [Thelohanellus kitauei]